MVRDELVSVLHKPDPVEEVEPPKIDEFKKRIDELMDESVTRRRTGIYSQLLRIVSGASTQS